MVPFVRAFSIVGKEGFREPTLEEAKLSARKFRELSNDAIGVLAVSGHYGARKERLRREIMRADGCTWAETQVKLEDINRFNDQYAWLVTIPYRVAVGLGIFAAATALPLVFDINTAAWFNETFVHEDLPEGGLESLTSVWKVGNWTWGWMEPYLGTASFILLSLQFARVNMVKISWKPYTETVLSWRADRLAAQFPQYERQIVRDFSKSDPWHE
eukprot:CAMPEP_0114539890 /NCGR_PEP_ID=MMETSP0114-20121206/478_1 /TAXON_ID=31324 /ORGANISM="Goniomonas sp, Strain m" /LENGTH=214 /DNA_ID=CAMNT_0001724021 /DNA_START=43 /DNA_END=687 /DNA_ORIENTATION=-